MCIALYFSFRMATKRRRKLLANETETRHIDEQFQRLGLSIMNLPTAVVVEILLKLSAKSVVACKSVCKAWHGLISDPQFAELHFAQAKPCALVRTEEKTRISRALYVVDPEDVRGFDFGECSCEEATSEWDVYCNCYKSMKLGSKLKIPLRNAQFALGEKDGANVSLQAENGASRKRCTKLNLKPRDHKCNVVNSCNGLLCLSEPLRNNPVAICNPITGEFVNLPKAFHSANYDSFVDCGLGFSTGTNQYKVVRIITRFWVRFEGGLNNYHSTVAEVHTLGTSSWRRIGDGPYSRRKLGFPTFLNGFLHWLCIDKGGPECIVSFNLDNEQFQSVPPPPCLARGIWRNTSLGVLRGCLCVCLATSESDPFDLWVMEEYGDGKSWTPLVSIARHDHKWTLGVYQPIDLKDEELLLFHCSNNALIYYHLRSTKFKFLKVRGLKSVYEAITHTPRFTPLTDILKGCNVEVQNTNSRYEYANSNFINPDCLRSYVDHLCD